MRHRDVAHPADPWITHPRRFGPPPVAVRSTKFLTVRNLITPSPRRSYDCVSANSLQCPQLRQERHPCRNQNQRSSSPVVGGLFADHRSSSAPPEDAAPDGNGTQLRNRS